MAPPYGRRLTPVRPAAAGQPPSASRRRPAAAGQPPPGDRAERRHLICRGQAAPVVAGVPGT